MKLQIAFACITIFLATTYVGAFLPQGIEKKAAAFTFADINYFHRYTINDQHEYTPTNQADLTAWTDMVTINSYRKAKEGEALTAYANSTLENYKAAQGTVLKTASVPRTKDKPAEHLVVAAFRRPAFTEVAFARFRMHKGVRSAVIYSHRVYGKTAWDTMNAWLGKNGPGIEKNLMAWDAMPTLPTSKHKDTK